MAVKFLEARNTLVRDLVRRGFEVDFVRFYSNGPGREIDICLSNGVVVNLDRHSSLVWAEGPPELATKVEKFLHRRYESVYTLRSPYVLFTTLFLGVPLRTCRFFARFIPRKPTFPRPLVQANEPEQTGTLELANEILLRNDRSPARS